MIYLAYASVSALIPICSLAPTGQSDRESAAARILLEQLWGEAREAGADLPKTMPRILRQAGGKPFFEGECAEFSLSHDGGCVLACLSVGDGGEARRVGVDLVLADREIARPRALAERFFTEGELDSLDSLGQADGETLRKPFLRIWAKKEAAVKLTGEGAAALSRTDTSRTHPLPLSRLGELGEVVGRACVEGEISLNGRRFFVAICLE